MIGRRQMLAGVVPGLAWAGSVCAQTAAPRPPGLRIAISATMLGDVNENDARATMRAWAAELSRISAVDVVAGSALMVGSADLQVAVRKGQLDAFVIALHEYLQMAGEVDPGVLMVDEQAANPGQEYAILVHRQKGLRRLEELRGRNLLLHRNPVMSLVGDWLETALPADPPDRFFSGMTPQPRLSKVVLPVYFQQADCCVTTVRSFAAMCEMNPQLGRDLEMLARSPRLIPGFLAFHKNAPAVSRNALCASLTRLHGTPAGKQALALFQSTRLVAVPGTALAPSIELVTAARTRKARRPKS